MLLFDEARALDLSQEAFAARFQIPLGTLRAWEQGVSVPGVGAGVGGGVIGG
jgi:putative transcriptional regulator